MLILENIPTVTLRQCVHRVIGSNILTKIYFSNSSGHIYNEIPFLYEIRNKTH